MLLNTNLYYFIRYATILHYFILLFKHSYKREMVINMKPLKKKVSVTLDENIISEIQQLAEECDRSFSQYVNLVLKSYLSTENKFQSSEFIK